LSLSCFLERNTAEGPDYQIPIENIQTVIFSQTPFDRRLDLASVSIVTAGRTRSGAEPKLRHLPRDRAHRIAADLAKTTAAKPFNW
jgi:membrane protein YdbS with pleckstrin-like domain